MNRNHSKGTNGTTGQQISQKGLQAKKKEPLLKENGHLLKINLDGFKGDVVCSVRKTDYHNIYGTKFILRNRQPQFSLESLGGTKMIILRRVKDEKLEGIFMEDGRFVICDKDIQQAYEMSKLGLDPKSLADLINNRKKNQSKTTKQEISEELTSRSYEETLSKK